MFIFFVKMPNGYVMIVRDKETGEIHVETTDHWLSYMEETPKRMIYCQAVSNVDNVQEKIDEWIEDEEEKEEEDNANDYIANMVSSIQWIANEHPIQSFRYRENLS